MIAARSQGATPKKELTAQQRAFLAALPECMTISLAAEVAGCDRKSHYRWMECPVYAAAFETARERSLVTLENEIARRAVHGTEKIKFDSKGNPIVDPRNPTNPDGSPRYYTEHVHSDVLAMFLAKGMAPLKYRERSEMVLSGEVNLRLMERMKQAQELLNGLDDRTSDQELQRSLGRRSKGNNKVARGLFRDRKRRRMDGVSPPSED